METAKNQYDALPSDRKSKSETLADAGIATSTAHDYEQLAGGKEKQAQDVAKAAFRNVSVLIHLELTRRGPGGFIGQRAARLVADLY